jgi:hypothetical protein
VISSRSWNFVSLCSGRESLGIRHRRLIRRVEQNLNAKIGGTMSTVWTDVCS